MQVFTDPELEAQAAPGAFQPPHLQLSPAELQDLLLRGLRQALGFSHALGTGLVLDSLRSRYADAATAMRLLLQALALNPIQAPEPEADPKAKKAAAKPAGGKGGGTPEPPQALTADAWEGPHDVFVVSVAMDRELVLQRVQARRAAREAEETARKLALEEAEAARKLAEGGEEEEQPPPPPAEPSEEERAAAAAAAAEALAAEAALIVDKGLQEQVRARQLLHGQGMATLGLGVGQTGPVF